MSATMSHVDRIQYHDETYSVQYIHGKLWTVRWYRMGAYYVESMVYTMETDTEAIIRAAIAKGWE